jgi:DNA-binding CsgD family transcriptional regulator
MSEPYRAAVRVVPLDEDSDQEQANSVVISITITVQPDGRAGEAAPAPALVPLPATLTRREREVLRLLAEHRTNREIAEQLVLSVDTIKHHVRSILEKLRVPNRHQATEIARRAFQL